MFALVSISLDYQSIKESVSTFPGHAPIHFSFYRLLKRMVYLGIKFFLRYYTAHNPKIQCKGTTFFWNMQIF